MMRLAFLSVPVCLAALPLSAEVLNSSAPVELVAVGGYCVHDPDENIPAPGTSSGTIGHNFGAFTYVVTGDRLRAAPSLGIGFRLRPGGVKPSEPVTMKIAYPDGYLSQWQAYVGADGEIEMGTDPGFGKKMMQGTYRFMVYRDAVQLFSFRMRVEGAESPGPCASQTS